MCALGSTKRSDPVEVEGGVLLPYNLPPDRSKLTVHHTTTTKFMHEQLLYFMHKCYDTISVLLLLNFLSSSNNDVLQFHTVCRQAEIVPFFTVIERERSLADKIVDYSISQTTLEEVFLNVCTTHYYWSSAVVASLPGLPCILTYYAASHIWDG